MIGLLLVVLILGLMAAVTLNSLGFSNSIPSSLRAPHSTSPAGGTADINQLSSPALVAACLADYVEISTAEQVYAALNSSPPSSGTSWAISLPVGQSQLATWPDGGKHFRIIWNGKAIEVRPHKGLESIGNAGSATERTGCYAVS
jgi:hypothetical protein